MRLVENTEKQYCGFKINSEVYAIPVLSIQEVINPLAITPIPLAPKFMKGLINLRGQIVTVLDLNVLFDIQERDESNNSMNIIIQGKEGLFALKVDEVTDIIDIDLNFIESKPPTIKNNIHKYISNVYKTNDGLISLLDIDKIINFQLAA